MSLLQKEHYALCVDTTGMHRLRREIGGQFVGTLHKYDNDRDPTKDDDAGSGFVAGSIWGNQKEERAFMCINNETGDAKWILLGEAGKDKYDVKDPAESENNKEESFEEEVIKSIDTDLIDSNIPCKEILVESDQVSNLNDVMEIYAKGGTSRKDGLASIDGIGQKKANEIEEWIISANF